MQPWADRWIFEATFLALLHLRVLFLFPLFIVLFFLSPTELEVEYSETRNQLSTCDTFSFSITCKP